MFCTLQKWCFFFTISTASRRHLCSPAQQIVSATTASRRSAKVSHSLFIAQAESSPPCAPLPCRGGCYHTPSPCEEVYHRGSPPCAINRSYGFLRLSTALKYRHSPMRKRTADGRKRPSLRRKPPSSPSGAPPQPSFVKASDCARYGGAAPTPALRSTSLRLYKKAGGARSAPFVARCAPSVFFRSLFRSPCLAWRCSGAPCSPCLSLWGSLVSSFEAVALLGRKRTTLAVSRDHSPPL